MDEWVKIPDNVIIPEGTEINQGTFISGMHWIVVNRLIVGGNEYNCDKMYAWDDPDFPATDDIAVENAIAEAEKDGSKEWPSYLDRSRGTYEFKCEWFMILEDGSVCCSPDGSTGLGRIDVDELIEIDAFEFGCKFKVDNYIYKVSAPNIGVLIRAVYIIVEVSNKAYTDGFEILGVWCDDSRYDSDDLTRTVKSGMQDRITYKYK